MRSSLHWLGAPTLLLGLSASPAQATVIHSVSGLSSAGVPVAFEAQLSIAGGNLTIVLTNTSPVDSLNPNDVLGSYYFDIVDGFNNRPTLTYTSATGNVFLADKDAADTLQNANADLRALAAGDNTWQYRTMDPSLTPFLGFGVGTVGNSNVAPNNFQGNIVSGIDFSIFKGDISTANLDGRLLVKETATFTFSGLTGFIEADIAPLAAFGLGTSPDTFLFTPAPGSLVLLSAGMLIGYRRRRTA